MPIGGQAASPGAIVPLSPSSRMRVACWLRGRPARATTHGFVSSPCKTTSTAKSLPPSGGGRLVLTARVRGATSYAFVGPLTPFAVVIPLDTVPCASGRAKNDDQRRCEQPG